MIPLDDERWNKWQHAFGAAFDVPEWLAQIARDPASSEPWSWMRATLCHQMSVYEPAYAAVPHLVELASRAPLDARRPHIEFTAHVEGCRLLDLNYVAPIPQDLESEYHAAVARLPGLVAQCAATPWDAETARIYAGALLIAKGHAHLGMTVRELQTRIRCSHCGEEFEHLAY